MKEKKFFYFADSHSFEYSFCVYWAFVRKNGIIKHRRDSSEWIEVDNYRYYGEPVKCIIPKKNMEYSFVFGLLKSKHADNIFGAINYLLCNYRERFLLDVKEEKCPCDAAEIIFCWFKNDVPM